MKVTTPNIRDTVLEGRGQCDATTSAVAWSAIIAGAVVAAAVSLILLFLGMGLGLTAVSPWAGSGISANSLAISSIIWLIVMQAIASGFGGYLTGRLRSKWQSMHTDEVYFRDTAHGFLSWALATLITAGFLTSSVVSVVNFGASSATTIAAGAATGAGYGASKMHDTKSADHSNPTSYFVDNLLRSNQPPATTANSESARTEVSHILAYSIKNNTITDTDKTYLAQVIATQAGIPQAEASKRIDDLIAKVNEAKEKAKQAAEVARKAAIHAALYIFLSMLIGAFVASSLAAIGGKHRDQY